MRNTRLAGHTLLREGKPHSIDGCLNCEAIARHEESTKTVGLRGFLGHGRCSCGDASECLSTDAERKRWHTDHKDEVRRLRGQSILRGET